MNDETRTTERNRLLTVAREYEEKGYRVVIEPGKADIPDFLAGFQPDIIAYGEKENVIIEVKLRSDLAKSMEMEDLASLVNSQRGWQFDLVVTNVGAAKSAGESSERLETLDKAEILDRLGTIRHLLGQGYDEAAFLLAWAATEAALRQIARSQRIPLDEQSPNYMIKQLFSLGALDRSDYNLLQRTLAIRNSIVHGFRASNFNKELVTLLCVRVQELLKDG